MNDYELKQEARKERLLARAEKYDALADARYKAAKAATAGIVFGQPILVGHHSERKHRADLAKQDRNMRKMVELNKLASRARDQASGVGSAGISSDDPEAADKIAARLAALEKNHTDMKLINRYLRAGNDAGLQEMGYTEAQIAKFKEPDFLNRTGFADYTLRNSQANITRLRSRLVAVKASASRETKEVTYPCGVKLVQNVEANRLQMVFPGKPAEETRKALKSRGFRWSPTAGTWQRQLSNSAINAAYEVIRGLQQ